MYTFYHDNLDLFLFLVLYHIVYRILPPLCNQFVYLLSILISLLTDIHDDVFLYLFYLDLYHILVLFGILHRGNQDSYNDSMVTVLY